MAFHEKYCMHFKFSKSLSNIHHQKWFRDDCNFYGLAILWMKIYNWLLFKDTNNHHRVKNFCIFETMVLNEWCLGWQNWQQRKTYDKLFVKLLSSKFNTSHAIISTLLSITTWRRYTLKTYLVWAYIQLGTHQTELKRLTNRFLS
jgi:hypothetical protein